jgi:CheY-like chemotaxis protein
MKLKDDPLKINLEQILASAEKGALLTQSLLTFSRQQTNNPEPKNINEIIMHMEDLLLRVIGENIELKTILASPSHTGGNETNGDLVVLVDAVQMDQVLINLATNARDAMPRGGQLTIRTRKVHHSALRFLKEDKDSLKLKDKALSNGGAFAEISISDTGTGIDEKDRGKIFEPFFTTKEVGKGTGLGLSIVYGIIKQHSGYITCESDPGRSTTFKIYLPVIKADIIKIKAEKIHKDEHISYTILLAEDELVVRTLTKQVLEAFGFKVIEAIDGEEAVRKFTDNQDIIDLLIFDIIMPRISGQEAYEKIKKIRPDVRVLLTSGYPSDFIRKEEILTAGIDFVPKPVSPDKLMKKVKEVMAH